MVLSTVGVVLVYALIAIAWVETRDDIAAIRNARRALYETELGTSQAATLTSPWSAL